MEYYETTLRAMEKLLLNCGETQHAEYISVSLGKWMTYKDTEYFTNGFTKGGIFEHFAFENTNFESEEKNYWTQQLFGGLTAMALQLAVFMKEGRSIDISFIRKNFGHPAELIIGSRCTGCNSKQINMADIDRYISMQIISTSIADGLEKGDLTGITEQIMNVTHRDINILREKAKLRAFNTGVDVSSGRKPMTVCLKCGGKNIVPQKFLKSLRELVFVPLSQ